MGASIPLPIACKAIALPFELITLNSTAPTFPLPNFEHFFLSPSISHLIMICTKCFLEGKLQCKEEEPLQSSKPILLGCQNIEFINNYSYLTFQNWFLDLILSHGELLKKKQFRSYLLYSTNVTTNFITQKQFCPFAP